MRCLSVLLLAAACSSPEAVDRPKSCGHSHNDQEHDRPLTGALEHGFCSVEVDVHLVGDALLVGHDLENTTPERTLESLYLEPLTGRAEPLFLMLDVKSEAVATWEAIDERLARFDLGAVRVVISGNAAREQIRGAEVRRASIDGRIPDLEAGVDSDLFPIISDKWIEHFTWIGGIEPMPPDQRRRLRELVDLAHAGGHRLRFWQTADRVEVWQEEIDAGVDLLNADDQDAVEALLAGG